MKRFLYVSSILLVSLFGFWACESQPLEDRGIFLQIFKDEASTFRGIEPGDPVSLVREKEKPLTPTFVDEIGISYEDTLSEGRFVLVDYLIDNLKEDKPREKVVSIVANIFMPNEVETATLYGQVATYFDKNYGVSSGLYGDYSWEGVSNNSTPMQVHLKMSDNKRGFTINFVDTQPYDEKGDN
ncbi:MAG: hypothetical protein AAF135_07830 [Bacteroidota bacterium]